MCAETILSLKARKQGKTLAGLTAFYNENYHYEIYLTRENQKAVLSVWQNMYMMFFVVTEKRKNRI